MKNTSNIQAIITTDSYLNKDDEIYLEFNCLNSQDRKIVKEIVEGDLLPLAGPTSFIANFGYDTIIPYYLDTNNELTFLMTDNLKSIVIPYYLVNCIFKRLIEKHNIDILFNDLVFESSFTRLDRELLYNTLHEKRVLSKNIKCLNNRLTNIG